jgi:hypothetical protein
MTEQTFTRLKHPELKVGCGWRIYFTLPYLSILVKPTIMTMDPPYLIKQQYPDGVNSKTGDREWETILRAMVYLLVRRELARTESLV